MMVYTATILKPVLRLLDAVATACAIYWLWTIRSGAVTDAAFAMLATSVCWFLGRWCWFACQKSKRLLSNAPTAGAKLEAYFLRFLVCVLLLVVIVSTIFLGRT